MRPGLVALLLAAACARDGREGVFSGTIEFPDVKVGSLVGGRVLKVLKREGEAAAAGEMLVELDPAEWQSALDEAKAQADAAARGLDLLLAGARPEEVARAEAEAEKSRLLWQVIAQGARAEEIAAAAEDVKAAEALLSEADSRLEREKSLGRTDAGSREALERATAERETARARKAAAEQRRQLLERGHRPEEVEAARQTWLALQARVAELKAGARAEEIAASRAMLDAAKARIALAETRLRELAIAAPADCLVQTLDLRPGDLIAPGAPVAVLVLRERPWVTVYVPEDRVAAVRLDGPAEVTPDGAAAARGKVTWISTSAEYTPRNVQTPGERTTQVFRVKVTLEGDVSGLKSGLWADVVFR
jgi:multidrug resistance efflux pump